MDNWFAHTEWLDSLRVLQAQPQEAGKLQARLAVLIAKHTVKRTYRVARQPACAATAATGGRNPPSRARCSHRQTQGKTHIQSGSTACVCCKHSHRRQESSEQGSLFSSPNTGYGQLVCAYRVARQPACAASAATGGRKAPSRARCSHRQSQGKTHIQCGSTASVCCKRSHRRQEPSRQGLLFSLPKYKAGRLVCANRMARQPARAASAATGGRNPPSRACCSHCQTQGMKHSYAQTEWLNSLCVLQTQPQEARTLRSKGSLLLSPISPLLQPYIRSQHRLMLQFMKRKITSGRSLQETGQYKVAWQVKKHSLS